MTRLFLDTNVVMDVFDMKRPCFDASSDLLIEGAKGHLRLIMSSISVLNTIYSVAKWKVPMPLITARVQDMLEFIEVAEIGKRHLVSGLAMDWDDVEDAVQFQAAMSVGRIDAIVSNDRDFTQQKLVPVLTPAQALKRLK